MAATLPRPVPAPAAPPADPPRVAISPDTSLVRVFERDPDLLTGTDPQLAARLRQLVVRGFEARAGRWNPDALAAASRKAAGVLVVEGLVARCVEINGHRATELLGEGDVFRPSESGVDDSSVPAEVNWTVIVPARFAILDSRFTRLAAHCPSLMATVLERSMQRARTLTLLMALATHRRADTRVELLLWHLADRWGRVTPDGVHIPYAINHRQLGELVCIRRPTVTTALAALGERGDVVRRTDGTWLLTGEPPASI